MGTVTELLAIMSEQLAPAAYLSDRKTDDDTAVVSIDHALIATVDGSDGSIGPCSAL